MFTTRLRIQQKFQKIFLAKNTEKVLSSVRDYTFWSFFKDITWKAIILLFFAAIIFFPFYIMLVIAFSSNEHLFDSASTEATWWFTGFNFDNLQKAFNDGYITALGNSVAVTVVSVVFKIFFTMFFGYAFSLKKWRFKKILWALFLTILILPDSALILGQFRIVVVLGWRKTGATMFMSLFAPYMASVINGFMYRNAFEQIPDRVKEAAMVDGCSELKYMMKVAIPMVSPTTWTVLILTSFAAWNSFLWPLIINGPKVINVWAFEIGMNNSDDTQINIEYGTKMAGSLLAILPMFIAFFAFRKRIMTAISKQGKAIKG
ncbi:carbohydrate ABC transporter permease [Candidatus Mycoplasma pogonae]